ncbi:MAG: chemotaxis protein CheA [SAR324 cluster bacterium]|nr:chemotaxis protein CheA [SAR324 cluster bacterium]
MNSNIPGIHASDELLRELGMDPQELKKEMEAGAETKAEVLPLEHTEETGVPETTPTAESSGNLVLDEMFLLEFLQETRENIAESEVVIMELQADEDNADHINKLFRTFHSVKGVSAFLNLNTISGFCHKTENVMDDVRSGKLPVTEELKAFILSAIDLLKALLADCEVSKKDHVPATLSGQYKSVINAIEHFRNNKPQAQQPPAEESVAKEPVAEEPVESSATPPPSSPKEVPKKTQTTMAATGGVIKVDTGKLDELINIVGELLIAQNMVLQDQTLQNNTSHSLQKKLTQLRRTTTTLQNTAMKMRMLPISATFRKMYRVVWDTANKTGKKIELDLIGEETEIDRMMVDTLHDPLVHMIRNSCDHGIELPEERLAVGKPETGRIRLEARHQGGSILIEIADDGRGIPADKIRNKALQKGLMTAHQELSDSQIIQFIFHPGFSTAEKVTDVSGRGVGMDVVKQTIDSLRGKVDIVSTPGQGSRFTIRLPLTLAIIDGMILGVGNDMYILPTLAVRETLQPTEAMCQSIQGYGEALFLRNQILPLIRVADQLEMNQPRKPLTECIVVIVEYGTQKCGLVADQIHGRQEVVIKNLGEKFKNLKEIAGCTILSDGTAALILDVSHLTSLVHQRIEKSA